MKLRVLIADDEPLSRARLRRFLRAEPNIEVVAETADGEETVKAIREKAPDLVFLDIRMPERDGFGVIKALSDGPVPAIIFVTAHDEFAARAFETDAVDYLLKPFDRDRFQAALRRARNSLQGDSKARQEQLLASVLARLQRPRTVVHRISIRSQGRIVLVTTAEIDWISAAANYVELHVGGRLHLLRTSIKGLVDELPAGQFIQISRSYMVNLDRIKEVCSRPHGDFEVILRDGTRLAGSRSHRHKLKRVLGADL